MDRKCVCVCVRERERERRECAKINKANQEVSGQESRQLRSGDFRNENVIGHFSPLTQSIITKKGKNPPMRVRSESESVARIQTGEGVWKKFEYFLVQNI